jgi:hypothetical protein
MTATAIPGKVYISPTDATSGGTQLVGIAEDAITFDDGVEVKVYGAGLEPDNWASIRVPGRPPKLLLSLGDVSDTARKLFFAAWGTGSNAVSAGGSGISVHAAPPAVSLVIRPRDTSQLYFYSPRVVLHPDHVAKLLWSRTETHWRDAVLTLLPMRSSDNSKRAWMLDTAANINTHYGL